MNIRDVCFFYLKHIVHTICSLDGKIQTIKNIRKESIAIESLALNVNFIKKKKDRLFSLTICSALTVR
jgi:hypothetical protein